MEKKSSWSSISFSIFKRKCSEVSESLGSRSSQSSESSTKSERRPIALKDFKVLRKIGRGGFGRVFLAWYKGPEEDSAKYVALKVINKKDIPKTKSERDHVKAEHFCLTQMVHPFLAKLYCSYQTPTKLFYAMEFLQGGELFTWMEKFGRFSQETAQFYLAEIFLALEYLHENHVIYRDVKPENIMLDIEGHIRLIDFGLSKVGVTERTKTLCGTNTYMAPEVLKKELYGFAVDWWALGILAYDMMIGNPPFRGSRDKQEVYRQILNTRVYYPPYLNMASKRFLKGLLTREPEGRLGHSSQGGSMGIRDHQFFESICFFDIYLKRVPPPFGHFMKVSSDGDLRNFDNLPMNSDIELGGLHNEDTSEIQTNDEDDELFRNFSYCDPDF